MIDKTQLNPTSLQKVRFTFDIKIRMCYTVCIRCKTVSSLFSFFFFLPQCFYCCVIYLQEVHILCLFMALGHCFCLCDAVYWLLG